MITQVDPAFKKELQGYGLKEWNDCFHCGNCTALCPLTSEDNLFPRKGIRLAQMGLKKQLSSSVDPWMCYYCGECSESCPRGAQPGELMMVLRRYLTSVYDWTGLSRKFYKNKIWEFSAIGLIAAAVIAIFIFLLPPASDLGTNSQAYINEQGGVMINSLAAGVSSHSFIEYIHYGDLIMALIVASLLVSNIINMFFKVIIRDKSVKIPFSAYFTGAWKLVFNFAAQPKFSKCDSKSYWMGHLFLMTGYTLLFAMIVAFLPRFQIEEIKPWYNWQRLLGYYATFGLLFFLIYTTIGRIRKKEVKMRFSHLSDWIFIIMLGLTTISGILVHIFRLSGLPAFTYYTYVVHLAILVPMIIIEVPFSKWSHLAYRPFAVYFDHLKKTARKRANAVHLAAA
jgi:ferredoxin